MKINKTTGYAIQWLSSCNKTPEDIALELKLSVDQVIEYIEKHHQQNNTNTIETKSSQVKSKSKDLMIRHTRDKKINSVSIMTQEASMTNDELKKNITPTSNRNADCIFKPNG